MMHKTKFLILWTQVYHLLFILLPQYTVLLKMAEVSGETTSELQGVLKDFTLWHWN